LIFRHTHIQPAQLLVDHLGLFLRETLPGPILDLACGDCKNGIFLAQKGLQVVCCDRSRQVLDAAKQLAAAAGISIQDWRVDLEREGVNPLPQDAYGAVLVFRYLHRPLIPCIKKALRASGLLIYETFTVEQRRFGKPRNPDFLLNPGELLQMFQDWEVIHFWEGVEEDPSRAVAQLVCRKPTPASKW
jgi:SAM-dependent methyltransferase